MLGLINYDGFDLLEFLMYGLLLIISYYIFYLSFSSNMIGIKNVILDGNNIFFDNVSVWKVVLIFVFFKIVMIISVIFILFVMKKMNF